MEKLGNAGSPGLVALGRVVRTALVSQSPPWDQKDLVLVLAEKGFDTTTDKVSYLIKATHMPSPFLIQAIARLKICLKPDGKPYTTDDLLDIAAGRLSIEPQTAQDLILAEMHDRGMTLAAFAKHVRLSQSKIKVLLSRSGGNIEPEDVNRLCAKVKSPSGQLGDFDWWAAAIGIKKGTPQSADRVEKPNGASNGATAQGAHHPR